MAVIYKVFPKHDCIVGVWEIVETLENLKERFEDTEIEQINKYKSEVPKLQWLSCRILLKELLSEIDPETSKKNMEMKKSNTGKPYFKNIPYHFSIAHSGNRSAVVVHKSKAVGIDIEKIDPKIEKTAHKFIPQKDLINITSGDKNKLENMYVFWSAKEAIYKLYGKGNLDFLKNISLEKFRYDSSGVIEAAIQKEDYISIKVKYEKLDGYMLAYAIER